MNRIPEIQQKLGEYQVEALLLAGPINRRWATGYHTSAGALFVTKGESLFLTDSRYIERARQMVQGAQVEETRPGESIEDALKRYMQGKNIQSIGFEEEVISQANYAKYQEKFGVELIACGKMLDDLRQVKTTWELEKIKAAQSITEAVFAEALTIINPKMTEKELSAELIYRCLKKGAEGMAFSPIVVSGTRSSAPHGTPGNHLLEGFITIDFGAQYEGYVSDMTRTVALGQVSAEMDKVYHTVLQAQEAGIQAACGGVSGKAIDKAARDVITTAGYGEHFRHGFGHSLGLEVHEGIRAAAGDERILPPGSVISAEPGIYLPGMFGVRIEDTLHLTETGAENLTKSPKNLIIL